MKFKKYKEKSEKNQKKYKELATKTVFLEIIFNFLLPCQIHVSTILLSHFKVRGE